jgi:aminoglycoside phosphotransferase (APT) family kinase protein
LSGFLIQIVAPHNFMFDEASGQITAVLDWELAHIGDFHEDLAFNLLPMFGNQDALGNTLIAGLYAPDDYLRRYEAASGRKVDPATLRFYEILNFFKLVAITHASSARVALEGLTHQDVLLSFVVPQGHCVASDLCRYLREEA